MTAFHLKNGRTNLGKTISDSNDVPITIGIGGKLVLRTSVKAKNEHTRLKKELQNISG